ncbi:putative leucine-tRNA ligase, cytoplasmic [Zancudomyces culisetae]|uniref:leucine--tRNA ligase n=1 Tax=Zancudomyces culisetae TaxID=1213189 RepID=A0A1R1PY69_ZANCU|nr:putative leucine-tRNA ligase, cytoplasmic [Zancudomyces culisetae]|eukprot:OMH85857.1 putative leucine-tRNA ligase, cytoplasmic [Zancudomyces culisetae]
MEKVPVEKKTGKRDALVEMERAKQASWEASKLDEREIPIDVTKLSDSETEAEWMDLNRKHPKYMVTFPYPYMNGRLHLGHSFSISKAEFCIRWERLKGKNALFPLGFHVTGMPIKASADKIARELELFGPEFDGKGGQIEQQVADISDEAERIAAFDAIKKEKRGLAGTYQHEIMQSLGIPNSEIKKFSDPAHWLEYFPPRAIQDVKQFGCGVDWRRSFITTDANKYYDQFARWQFTRLRQKNKIKFGKRYTIWSAKDGQPCMDHDRMAGEGVGPQEYTAIKFEVEKWSDRLKDSEFVQKLKEREKEGKVFMVAATLRPETAYGITNVFVGEKIEYGAFEAPNGEIYLSTARAAKNMAFQGHSRVKDAVNQIATVVGHDLIGTQLQAPFSEHKKVYVLPMDNVSSTKGTGIVMSVPSDSPDDYVSVMMLKKKPAFYGIEVEWVQDPIAVVDTPTYGTRAAEMVVTQMKIQSAKDVVQLSAAKELVYKEGFYNGTMVIGKYKGMAVQEAKPLVRADMLAEGTAFAYAEPEGFVLSRSGDECIVALCDQWYMDYGEDEWRKETQAHLNTMETGSIETRHQFNATMEWLNQWACARSFGLGSKVPWDDSILIESLSDSTIYMAYYTISHLLHPTSLDHSSVGPLGITPEDMDDAAWDYVFLGLPLPETHAKQRELKFLRRSFLYWYPLDLRTSGKDLIQNHLTFFLYNHTAIFGDQGLLPRGVRCNGHLLLNGAKMSKSTGNFMTLHEAVEKYGADATRVALADAGDGLEDANFEESTANAAILRLFSVIEWALGLRLNPTASSDTISSIAKPDYVELRSADSPLSLVDKIFVAYMDLHCKAAADAFESMSYRQALKSAFYEMLAARDWYRDACGHCATSETHHMHAGAISSFIERLCVLMAPVAPHWADYLWVTVLGKAQSLFTSANETKALLERFSKPLDIEHVYRSIEIGDYIKQLVKSIRDAEFNLAKQNNKKSAKNQVVPSKYDASSPLKTLAVLYYPTNEFPFDWQQRIVQTIRENYPATPDAETEAKVRSHVTALLPSLLKAAGPAQKDIKRKALPFASELLKNAATIGTVAFDRPLLFSECDVLQQLVTCKYLHNVLGFSDVSIAEVDPSAYPNCAPGAPSFVVKSPQASSTVPDS